MGHEFDAAWDALYAEFKKGNIMALHDVQTGGGIWAILFDRWAKGATAGSTYAVFYDMDHRPAGGYVIQRHEMGPDDDAFWSCQHGCPTVHVDDATKLVDGEILDALKTECAGGDACDACGSLVT